MQDNHLLSISLRLSHLERELLDEYARIEAEADPSVVYLVVPGEHGQAYLERLQALFDELHGADGSGQLQLVTDEHDQLRIRIIVLRNLLQRDVPISYLQRILDEIQEHWPAAARQDAQVSARTAPARKDETSARGKRPLFGRLFGSKAEDRDDRDRHRPAAAAPPRHAAAADEGEQLQLPLEVMRTMGLHYLMEEDRLKLIKAGQEMPNVTHNNKLPPSLSRFVARDLAETHFATRAPARKIARTPEELRRKLAERSDQ